MSKRISIFILTALMVGVAAMASAQGPVAWYKFDDGSGTAATDSSGNGLNGVVSGGVTWSTAVDLTRVYDLGPSCLQFNNMDLNPDSVVTVAHNTLLNAGMGALTVSFFVKIAPPSGSNMRNDTCFLLKGSMNQGDGTPGDPAHLGKRYEVTYKSDQLRLVIDDGDIPNHKMQYAAQLASGTGVVTGSWVHVAATADITGQIAHLYINGVEATGSVSGTGWPTESIDEPSPLYIGNRYVGDGASTYNANFTGLMDDVRIYTRALNLTEIQAISAFIPTPTPTPTNTPTPTPAGVVYWEIFD